MTKDEALKMAIEAFVRWEDTYKSDCTEVINACKEALKQPEGKEFFERGKEIARWADKQVQEPVELIRNENGNFSPKHQWQGLTDDEIFKIGFMDYMDGDETIEVVREIEAKLKEKNT